MKHGISVRYRYDGDPKKWETVIGAFIAAVSSDPDLKGRFTYHVQRARTGEAYLHIGRWDRPETVELLQSRPYFAAFAQELRAMAGDSLTPQPFDLLHTATP